MIGVTFGSSCAQQCLCMEILRLYDFPFASIFVLWWCRLCPLVMTQHVMVEQLCTFVVSCCVSSGLIFSWIVSSSQCTQFKRNGQTPVQHSPFHPLPINTPLRTPSPHSLLTCFRLLLCVASMLSFVSLNKT